MRRSGVQSKGGGSDCCEGGVGAPSSRDWTGEGGADRREEGEGEAEARVVAGDIRGSGGREPYEEGGPRLD